MTINFNCLMATYNVFKFNCVRLTILTWCGLILTYNVQRVVYMYFFGF